MRSIFPPVKSKPTFNLDFSLAYVGIFLLSFSILGTELTKLYPQNRSEIIQIRIIHTIFLIAILFLTQLILKAIKLKKSGYLELAIIGICLSIASLFFRVYLMNVFGLISNFELQSYFFEQLPISLVQAFFWIPVVIILGAQRNKIFAAFKEYEKRLIISARRSIRQSNTFDQLKKQVDKDFRDELELHTHQLLGSLTYSDDKEKSLSEKNEIIQRYLKYNNLREFSSALNKKSESLTGYSKFNQDMHSLSLISKQFNILYNYVARKSPIPAWVYTLLTFVLILPNYVHFFTAKEILLSLPPYLVIHLIAVKINNVLTGGGKYAVLQANLLTILIGFMPFLETEFARLLIDNSKSRMPWEIIALFYPLGYFVYIRFIQIIQPAAISAIELDEIYASPALTQAISKIVKDEFRQSMAHQWATYIHGKILTRLAATSLKLEQAVANNDPKNFQIGLDNLKQILENPTREFEYNRLDLSNEIASRLDPWEGLISINLKIDPELEAIANERVKDLGEAIEEIISNSVRHGGSQNILIDITSLNHPDIHVRIEDDAINPLPSAPARIGLGTKILNLVSDGRWSIARGDAKTTVNLTMSILD